MEESVDLFVKVGSSFLDRRHVLRVLLYVTGITEALVVR